MMKGKKLSINSNNVNIESKIVNPNGDNILPSRSKLCSLLFENCEN